jgi:hypothetical protein
VRAGSWEIKDAKKREKRQAGQGEDKQAGDSNRKSLHPPLLPHLSFSLPNNRCKDDLNVRGRRERGEGRKKTFFPFEQLFVLFLPDT